MNRPALVPLLLALLAWTGAAHAADIDRRTAIVCVFEESRSLTAFRADAEDGKADKVRSWFTEWLFSSDEADKSARIRFLWIPDSSAGSKLRIDSKDTHHVLIRLMSQTRNSLLAASSSSDILTSVGWLFAINFRLEQVLASNVRSNAGGIKSQAVRLSCTFDSEAPEAD